MFLKSIAAVGAGALVRYPLLHAAIPKMKITRIRAYAPPNPNPLFNQADTVVTIETDAGITGIGEGGFADTLRQGAGRLIGQDPQHIERLWQDMHRSYFYPPGREREHALGALDLALWDIRGKALQVPVHQILGGMARNYCECYNTGGTVPGIVKGMSLKERAAATLSAGYRAFRMGAADTPANTTYNTREKLNQMREQCAQVREGVGPKGDWCIDFHQRFDLADAIRGCDLIEEFAPLFVEDPVRAEAFNDDLPKLRKMVKVPIAAGEQWGNR
jgi:L-alanine-DL-glutamate epimerase-like enolase superfamily enzyme